jgi:hypothetical protein
MRSTARRQPLRVESGTCRPGTRSSGIKAAQLG